MNIKTKRSDESGETNSIRWGWRSRLPIIWQTEEAECGLACLAMICSYFGQNVSLRQLRGKYSISLKGMNLTNAMEVAGDLGFETRPLRINIKDLPRISKPCVLHWDMNHFVVLKHATEKYIVIHDPARGILKLSIPEVSSHFTGIALEFWPTSEFKPIKGGSSISLKSLTGKIKGLPKAFSQIFILALTMELFALVGPLYMQWVLDHVFATDDRDLLLILAIGFLALTIFQAAISAARSWVIVWLSETLKVKWVSNMFSHLLTLPLVWYEKRHVGDILSRFGSMQAIQHTLTTEFVAAILDGLLAVLTLGMMMYYSSKLSLIVLAAFFAYGILRWLTFNPLRRAEENKLVYLARQESELMEAVRGVQTLKAYNQQRPRAAHYANSVVETINRDVSVHRLKILFASGNKLIFGIERVVLVWAGAVLVMGGSFTAGMLIAFVAYAEQFVAKVSSLIDKLIEFRMLRLHGERVADIALSEPEQFVRSYHSELPVGEAADVEVRNVSFRYAAGDPWILKNCSITIASGDSVGLIGPSGCGKTTLVKIILGLLEPVEGMVMYGGVDIRKLGLGRYRSRVATVMQDDQLFAGSIAGNIACFDVNLDLEGVEAAAKLASIHEDIIAMPMGYQTLVGDMGSTLSGGQKQRVLLARALYRKPELLVLDEATSHLDIKRESEVNNNISHMRITRLIIAHRPETINCANRIYQVINGMLMPVA